MSKARTMTDDQIMAMLRQAALFEREHTSITYEHGVHLVDLVGAHGDKLADAMFEVARLRTALNDIASGVACLPGYGAEDAAAAARQALAPRVEP